MFILTLALDDMPGVRTNGSILQPAVHTRSRQACYAGPSEGLARWLRGYVKVGTTHLVLRFAGDHERHLQMVAALRSKTA